MLSLLFIEVTFKLPCCCFVKIGLEVMVRPSMALVGKGPTENVSDLRSGAISVGTICPSSLMKLKFMGLVGRSFFKVNESFMYSTTIL